MRNPHPPFLPGIPILGNAIEFQKDPVALFRRGYKALGPVFAVHLAGKPAVVLIGPEYNRFFFEQTDHILSMPEAYRFLIPMFGKRTFFVAGHQEYLEQRAMMLPAFSGRKMGGYVEVMSQEACNWLDSLGKEGVFELVNAFEQLTMFVAASALMGTDFRRRMGREFWSLYRDLAAGIEFVLPTNLPLPKFRRRDKAKARLTFLIRQVIAERRTHPGEHDDFLQVFIDSHYSDGSPAPEEVIESLILGMVFAGHETTAGHASWGLVQLLQNPGYLQRVVNEVDEILGNNGEISLDKIRRMEQLDRALHETERIRPVASLLMRYTRESYDIGNYHVPAGWLTFISPAVSHRIPSLFTDPDLYDPDRFAPGREEDRRDPYSLVGFGGGLHKCLGMNFAYNEMKVIFSLLLNNFQLELLDANPKPDTSSPTSRPSRSCRVRYIRRT
jgi:sterol 14-demethylase